MVSGQCPHPWNKSKKGTFLVGHSNINKELKGSFEKGRVVGESEREQKRVFMKKLYSEKKHSFFKFNELRKGITVYWYGISKREWTKLSNEVRSRDSNICQSCGAVCKKGESQCHHIIPFRWFWCNDKDNLTTLCVRCHGIIEHNTQIYLVKKLNYYPRLPSTEWLRSFRSYRGGV